MAGMLDVIMRFHDPARLDELGRAVFSVALGAYRPLTIRLVCQRFDAAHLAAVRDTLAPIMEIAGDVALDVLNHTGAEPLDARAALLNLGLRAATGQFAAFLDYDDLIYPEGYGLLIDELVSSGAAIAFGGILNAYVSREGLVPLVTAKRRVFEGEGLRQLLHNNFCPMHSFVLDRSRIDPDDLVADESLAALEDYDLLLRICAHAPSSFRLKDTIIGEYVFKDDDSNINPLAHAPRAESAWEAALQRIQLRKAKLVLAPAVQEALLAGETPYLSVAEFLAR